MFVYLKFYRNFICDYAEEKLENKFKCFSMKENKAYRPNAYLLDIVMHYNGKYNIILHYYYNHLN